MILRVQQVAEELGKTPTYKEFISLQDEIKGSMVRKYFGTWNEFLTEADLSLNLRRNSDTSRNGLIEQCKTLAEELGRTPTEEEFDSNSKTASSSTAINHFGSWNKFLKDAGLKPNQEMLTRASRELVIAQVKMLADELERTPTCDEFVYDSRTVSYHTIRRRFGSWNNLLEASGLEKNLKMKHGGNFVSDEEIIQQVKEMAERLGRTPKVKDFKMDKSTIGITAAIERFGSWNNLLEASGLEPNFKIRVGITRQELIEQVQELAEKLGRVPQYSDFNGSNKTAGVSTVLSRFGTWKAFLRAAGLIE